MKFREIQPTISKIKVEGSTTDNPYFKASHFRAFNLDI